MEQRFIHEDMEVEFLDTECRLQVGRVYYVYHDGTVAVMQASGVIVITDAAKLRSAVYHPMGTGVLQIKRTMSTRRQVGTFACATCHTLLTEENASPSNLRNGGHCRVCRGALTKRTTERRKQREKDGQP